MRRGESIHPPHGVRKHALRGNNLLIEMPFLEKMRDIVLYHHERYDGAGYPNGLKGNAIPLRARIVAGAEAYDTMTTGRAYHAKMSVEEAMKEAAAKVSGAFVPPPSTGVAAPMTAPVRM